MSDAKVEPMDYFCPAALVRCFPSTGALLIGTPHRAVEAGPRSRPCLRSRFVTAFAMTLIGFVFAFGATVAHALPGGTTWNDASFLSALSPESARGKNPIYAAAALNPSLGVPGGRLEDDGGSLSGNYQIVVPLLSFPGRGQNLDLNMIYSSQLWSKYYPAAGAKQTLEFNVDQDWPSAGWSIGFGKLIIKLAFPGSGIIVNPDNSRQGLEWGSTPLNSQNKMLWIKGSPLSDVELCCSTTGHYKKATLRRRDGSSITYESAAPVGETTAYYPVQITDAHGNFITISYVRNAAGQPAPPAIESVVDTVGRIVKFNYDTQGRLVAVTGPGLNSTDRTYARFVYSKIFFGVNSGPDCLSNNVVGGLDGITGVIFPSTQTAYFLEGRTNYGMATEVWETRGVKLDAPSLNDQGQLIDQGLKTRNTVFNYPNADSNNCIKNPPAYSTRTVEWADPVSGGTKTAITRFSTQVIGDNRVTTVSYPDDSMSTQIATLNSTTPNDPSIGLVRRIETRSRGGAVIGSQEIEWERGFGAARQHAVIERIDPLSRWKRTVFTYGGTHSADLVREDHYSYQDDQHAPLLAWSLSTDFMVNAQYDRAHVFNLPVTTRLTDGATGAQVSRTDFAYDETSPDPVGSLIQHSIDFEPKSAHRCSKYEIVQVNGKPKRHCIAYAVVDIKSLRGDVTTASRYIDSSSKLKTHYRYDSAGNITSTFDDSGAGSQITYDASTLFSLPTVYRVGALSATSPLKLTSTVTYDLPTGLTSMATDADQRATQWRFVEGSSGWRLAQVIHPDRTVQKTVYDDLGLALTNSVIGPSNAQYATSIQYYDGRGLLRRSVSKDDADTMQDTDYDSMQRVIRMSRAYKSGEIPKWTTMDYDASGRIVAMNAIDDRKVSWIYDEQAPGTTRPHLPQGVPGDRPQGSTVRSVDPWGRETWTQMDEFGLPRYALTPHPGKVGDILGDGGSLTEYTHDAAGRVTRVMNGTRSKTSVFDGLGRMTRQLTPEGAATLDVDGKYVGASPAGRYSAAFFYDARSNLIRSVDARGVKKVFDFNGDPLNRLQRVSYDVTGPLDPSNEVLAVQPATFHYAPAGNLLRATGADQFLFGSETLSYDANLRPSAQISQLQDIPGHPFEFKYSYDEIGRVTGISYPVRYGADPQARGRSLGFSYASNQMVGLMLDGKPFVSDIRYNSDRMVKQFSLETSKGKMTQTIDSDPISGLIASVRATDASGTSLLSLEYHHRLQSFDTQTQRRVELPGMSPAISYIRDLRDDTLSQDFSYDSIGRLTSATRADGIVDQVDTDHYTWQAYQYDAAGNKTATAAYKLGREDNCPSCSWESVPLDSGQIDGIPALQYDDRSNRVTTAPFSYDATGNLIRSTIVSNGVEVVANFTYDAAGRLVRISRADNGALLEAFKYGLGNQRLAVTTDGSNWEYSLWFEGRRLSKFIVPDPQAQVPLWSEDSFYLGRRRIASENMSHGNYSTSFHIGGHIGTELTITDDSSGIQMSRRSIRPFGTEASTVPPQDPVHFASYERSSVTGLDYAVNRFYDPRQGRFLQPDPLHKGLNGYAYSNNDPVNFADPQGLDPEANPCDAITDPGLRYALSCDDIIEVVGTAPYKFTNSGYGRSGYWGSWQAQQASGAGAGAGAGGSDPKDESSNKKSSWKSKCGLPNMHFFAGPSLTVPILPIRPAFEALVTVGVDDEGSYMGLILADGAQFGSESNGVKVMAGTEVKRGEITPHASVEGRAGFEIPDVAGIGVTVGLYTSGSAEDSGAFVAGEGGVLGEHMTVGVGFSLNLMADIMKTAASQLSPSTCMR